MKVFSKFWKEDIFYCYKKKWFVWKLSKLIKNSFNKVDFSEYIFISNGNFL